MTIDRITASQFADKLRTALLSRTKRYDTAFGPVPDVVINPLATVLEDQNNNRLRRVSLLLSLQNSDEFTEDELNATVFNEDLLRPIGSSASTVLTFRRRRPFSSSESGLIPRGFPIGTSIDESSGQAVTFVTTETKDKTSAISVLDTSTNSTVVELEVPAVCTIRGSAGKVGPDRINRPLRPLTGWDSVTNNDSTQEGRDRYTNDELIELYLLAVTSRQLSVPTGAEFYVRDAFPSVEDVHEVFGTDPLLERAGSDAGAVDSYIIGDNIQTATDTLTFLGIGQKIVLDTPPVVRIDTVMRVSDSEIFEEGSDYEVALDSTGVSGSIRGKDGIKFLPTVTATPALAVGDQISITYAYNQLVRDLQADADDPQVEVMGRDLLFRLGERVDIFLDAELTILSGFTPSDTQTAVETVVLDTINALELGQAVEQFDIETAVGRLSGVDNFVFTRLVRSSIDSGVSDISILGAEYARIDSINLVITLA